MLDLRTMILAAVAAFLVGAGAAWWITADYKEAKYTSAISKMQIDAANALTEATRRATEQERENNRLATELEVAHNEYKSKLDEVYADNLRITSEFGGLYDSRAASDNCPMPAAPSASPNPIKPPAGAKLSDSLTQLLLTESRRADEAAAYAQTCYEWVKKLGG